AIEGVLRVYDAAGDDAFAALEALESGKARTLLDWMGDPPQRVDAAAARALTAAVHALALDSSRENQRDVQRRLLETRTVSRQATPLDAVRLREHVDRWPGVAFLSYWLGRDECWVVWARDGRAGVVELGERSVVEPLLRAAHDDVADPRSDPDEALAAAARCFLGPDEVRACLVGAERVVFCPDEELGALPFEAIPFDGIPIGIGFPIERTPSLSIRDVLASRTSHGHDVAIVHSVVGTRALETRYALDPLEESGAEAALVVRAHDRIDELRGDAATVDGFSGLLARGPFDLVHVSAHVVAAAVPTESLLVLADAPASVATLVGLPLRGALVVLSACGSATGEARSGEGEVGLLGWPFAAGARGAVASMWSVNQQATKDLMGQFHAILAEGRDAVEAMQVARATLAAASNYEHPYYWAGFGVFAAPPLPSRPVGAWLAWSGAGIALSAALAYWLRRRSG
ncbi:MAG: CHAT domain-containing protein, partial [Planctomycetes bacterium]|nr:CHAT domain-containing protein [Planctomycetota bacterium]